MFGSLFDLGKQVFKRSLVCCWVPLRAMLGCDSKAKNLFYPSSQARCCLIDFGPNRQQHSQHVVLSYFVYGFAQDGVAILKKGVCPLLCMLWIAPARPLILNVPNSTLTKCRNFTDDGFSCSISDGILALPNFVQTSHGLRTRIFKPDLGVWPQAHLPPCSSHCVTKNPFGPKVLADDEPQVTAITVLAGSFQ